MTEQINQEKLNELKKQAKNWAMKNLVGKKVFQKDIKAYIFFTSSGIDHSI